MTALTAKHKHSGNYTLKMIEQMGKHPWNIWKSCTTILKQGLGGTASSDICVTISLLFTQFVSMMHFFFSVFRVQLFHTLIPDAD